MSGSRDFLGWESDYMTSERSSTSRRVLSALDSERGGDHPSRVVQALEEQRPRRAAPAVEERYEEEEEEEEEEEHYARQEHYERGEEEEEEEEEAEEEAPELPPPSKVEKQVRITFLTGTSSKVAKLLSAAGVRRVASFSADTKKRRTTIETFTEEDADRIIELLVEMGRPDYAYVEDVIG